jgi:hypothetical protein
MIRVPSAVVAAIVAMAAAASSTRAQWLYETGAAAEADFVNLQFPATLSAQAAQPTPFVYGLLYEAGLTEANGEPVNVLAQMGYGPLASDPRVAAGWSWTPAFYNVQIGNNDEFKSIFTAPATPGSYSYTYRFSLDNGANWTAADLDGAGANTDLSFSAVQLGVLTVTGPAANEIDYAALQFPPSLNVQASQSTGLIYGQLFDAGLTSLPGEPDGVVANLGYGPAGTDPRTSPEWTWMAAGFNVQVGNNDEFKASFTAPSVNGVYHYTYRFSLTGGTTWTVGDLDGNGTNSGLALGLDQLGTLTVTGGINPAFHPADFNKDSVISGEDLAAWRTAFGSVGGADADKDGDSDGADFLRWQRALGATAVGGAAEAAPEPTGAALVMMGLAAAGACASRRRIRARSASCAHLAPSHTTAGSSFWIVTVGFELNGGGVISRSTSSVTCSCIPQRAL